MAFSYTNDSHLYCNIASMTDSLKGSSKIMSYVLCIFMHSNFTYDIIESIIPEF